MANKKRLKTYTFSSLFALLTFLAACKGQNNDEQASVQKKPQTEVKQTPAPVQKPIQKTDEQIWYEHFYDIRDSIATANGADELLEQLESKQADWQDMNDIRDLEYPYSLGATMNREVLNAGSKIIDDAYNKIVTGLAKYNVSLDGAISKDSTQFIIHKGVLENWNQCLSKWSMCFTGVESDYDYADYQWNTLIRAIDTVISSSDYGTGQQANMRTMVSGIIDNAKQEVFASRTAIEKEKERFYQFMDKKHVGLTYGGEGSEDYGYDDMNDEWCNPKYLNTERLLNAYDRNLNVDFFGDADTKYTLVSLGDGKWQVVKKAKDGTVSTTHVFQDPKEIEIDTVPSNKPQKVGDYAFSYTPGQNYGVHVSSSEVIGVQRRKKDWPIKLPADVQHKVDSLNQEMQEKEALSELLYQIDSAARTIAWDMAVQKYGPKPQGRY